MTDIQERNSRQGSSSRDDILDAAKRVAGREGAANLTLDKVAKECGLSKGGLLYNFRSKDALLEGMLERLLEQNEAMMTSESSALAGEPNVTIRSLLRCIACHQTADPQVYLSIIAASVQNPALLEPLKAKLARYHEEILKESDDPTLTLLLLAAADGLLLNNVLGIAPYSNATRNELFQRLLSLSEELL
jgi:AcrR family transcriptional regulator